MKKLGSPGWKGRCLAGGSLEKQLVIPRERIKKRNRWMECESIMAK